MSTQQVTTFEPPTVCWPPAPRNKWEREYAAFQALLPQLLTTHRGKFVAIHDQEVVDSDNDDVALTFRVLRRLGNVPIHVGLVADQPLAPVRIPHYREAPTFGDK